MLDRDFSYRHYRDILHRITRTHRPLSFGEAARLGRHILDIPRFVIMRHDVEISLPAAERLAEFDADAGVRSTFFLLPTADYNCFEEDGARAIRNILSLGHEIGLHYDAGLMERLGVDPVTVTRSQIAAFETFFATKIEAMSSHLPTRSGRTFGIPGVVDVYDELYFATIKYVSDSTQRWREGVVTGLLDRYAHIHLLTHECNWSEEGLGWDDLMLREGDTRSTSYRARTLANIATFRAGLASRARRDAEFRRRLLGEPVPVLASEMEG